VYINGNYLLEEKHIWTCLVYNYIYLYMKNFFIEWRKGNNFDK